MVSYEFPRLGFRADVIEPLGDDDEFQVVSPVGTFRMTKAQFYSIFANVVRTMSYRERGLYHYPTVPAKAERVSFLHAPQTVNRADVDGWKPGES